jgi:hypothetical protein
MTLATLAVAQDAPRTAEFFGFGPTRTIVVDDGCGPAVSADFNGDGRPDIAVVNNRKSRIEIHYLRAAARTEAEMSRELDANELAPSPWYDRREVGVRYRISALAAHDADGDGRMDLVFTASEPVEVVVLAQRDGEKFETYSRQRVRGLQSGAAAMAIGNVIGDERAEVVAIAEGRVCVLPLSKDGRLGEATQFGSPAELAAIFIEDFDGDGLSDVLAVAPSDSSPLRLWRQKRDERRNIGTLPVELRFETPALVEAEPVRLVGDRGAALLSVIERQSRRLRLLELAPSPAVAFASGAESDSAAEVRGFVDGSSKDRSVAVADLDADGLVDMLATDRKGNALVVHRQVKGAGLVSGEAFPTLKNPDVIVAGQWDDDKWGEVFVLSTDEATVGVSQYEPDTGRVSFPAPIPLYTPGAEPVAMQYVRMDDRDVLAVVVKQRRDFTLELHARGTEGDLGQPATITLKGFTRPPQTILSADVNRDDRADLLLLTPGEPMAIVLGAPSGLPGEDALRTKEQMKQFGLVQSAGPGNTALADFTGEGKPDLIVADQNFVRACAYDDAGGWVVLDQANVREPGTALGALTTMDKDGTTLLVASDSGSQRLIAFERGKDGRWSPTARIRLQGVKPTRMFGGAFSGDGGPGVLLIAEDAFTVVRPGGAGVTLAEVSSYRSDDDDRIEHEIEAGDINGDGYTDLVVLDAGEQMCEILSISAARRLVPAMEFKVFESMMFTRGRDAEYEPSAALVADLTGDGKDDVMLTVHDRLMIYPQE